MLISPHGDVLVNQLNPNFPIENTIGELWIDRFSLSLLECLAIGAFSPLKGFMKKEEYDSVLNHLRLPNGLVWSIPITLPINEESVESIEKGAVLRLVFDGVTYGVITVEELYTVDKENEVLKIYGTKDQSHPGVKRLMEQPACYAAGPIQMIKYPSRNIDIAYYLTPEECRKEFMKKGWKTVVGFQTRNPIHRAHEYIQKTALETVDGLFIHPLVGETKQDDIPAAARMNSYEVLLQNYYSSSHTMLAAYPAPMWYAGPREAICHALVRKNYGCSHFIVGRDHAGVGNYYGTYDAQNIFSRFTHKELGITPLFFEHSFYCTKCQCMASTKTCPHDPMNRIILSGTKVREMMSAGKRPPAEFSRPEVMDILLKSMAKEPNNENK